MYSTFQHKWAMYPRPRPPLRNRKLGHVSGPRARVSPASEGVWCRHNCGQWRSLFCGLLHLPHKSTAVVWCYSKNFHHVWDLIFKSRCPYDGTDNPLKMRGGGSPLHVLWSCLDWWLAVFLSLTHYCGILWPDSCRPARTKLPRHRAQERTADCLDLSTLHSLPQIISFCVCGPLTSRPTLRVQFPCLRVQASTSSPPEDHKKCSVVLETGWELTLSRHVMEFSGDLSITIKTD